MKNFDFKKYYISGIYILYVGVGAVAMATSIGYISLAIKANLATIEYEKLDEQNSNGSS